MMANSPALRKSKPKAAFSVPGDFAKYIEKLRADVDQLRQDVDALMVPTVQVGKANCVENIRHLQVIRFRGRIYFPRKFTGTPVVLASFESYKYDRRSLELRPYQHEVRVSHVFDKYFQFEITPEDNFENIPDDPNAPGNVHRVAYLHWFAYEPFTISTIDPLDKDKKKKG
jgi:hypothetical protein